MTERFTDAYYFLALLNPGDQAHARTVAFAERMVGPIVTTARVPTEVADAMAAPPRRRVFLDLLRSLRDDPETLILPPEADLFDRGLDLYARRPDKA